MNPANPNSQRILRNGVGWRIGWNPNAEEFKGLVGGENWAIELTETELNDFCRLLQQLSETMNQMSSELMQEEKITCEAETPQLWMQVEGYPKDYTLQLMLMSGRRAEGNWLSPVVPELLQATQSLQSF